MEFLSYALPAAAVLFLAFQLYPIYKAWRMKGQAVPFKGLVDLGVDPEARLLVYFFAPRCGMCRSTTPVIDELLTDRKDILKVDAAEHPDIARAMHVMATPAFALIDGGKVERLLLGVKSRRQLLQLLDGS